MSFGRLLFRFRNPIAALPIVYALFSEQWEWEDTVPTWLLAGTLAVVGVALRAWATCHCRYSIRANKQLAVTGPYAYVRNPLYWGNILLILSAIVASELEWLLPVALLWALAVYSAVSEYEEAGVRARFGAEYDFYKAHVPAWIPNGRRFGSPMRPGERHLAAAFLRQAGNFVWLVPFLLKELNLFGLGDGD
jgi:protein-S-isoprenylcysteine O-methyltransferase Ste14